MSLGRALVVGALVVVGGCDFAPFNDGCCNDCFWDHARRRRDLHDDDRVRADRVGREARAPQGF